MFENQFQDSSITLQSVQDDFIKIRASKTKDWRFQVKVQKEFSSIHFIQDLKSHSTNTSSKATMHISRGRVHIHKRSFQDWRNQDKVNTFRTINKQLWFIPWKPSYFENLQTTLYTLTKPYSLFKKNIENHPLIYLQKVQDPDWSSSTKTMRKLWRLVCHSPNCLHHRAHQFKTKTTRASYLTIYH